MAQHAESEDDELQSLSKDGKLSRKKVDMLAQMATRRYKRSGLLKVSKADTAKDEIPKILALRVFIAR